MANFLLLRKKSPQKQCSSSKDKIHNDDFDVSEEKKSWKKREMQRL
jgi:hypothetical protein